MKVKATKTMAQYIKEHTTHKQYAIDIAHMDERQYAWYVDSDTYNHENDYNYTTNKFNVIVVEYPAEYYANNTYITTNDLLKCFNKSGNNATNFMQEIDNLIEI